MPPPTRLEIRNRTWLTHQRLDAGLTQGQLADKAGVSLSIVAKLEQGSRQRVDPATARLICGALDCSVTHLFRVEERVAS